MDVKGGAQFFHVKILKFSSMVCENGGWNPKVENDMVEDELRDLNSHSYNKGYGFDPLSKLVSSYNDPFVTFG